MEWGEHGFQPQSTFTMNYLCGHKANLFSGAPLGSLTVKVWELSAASITLSPLKFNSSLSESNTYSQ
jgi:hypothetical protein